MTIVFSSIAYGTFSFVKNNNNENKLSNNKGEVLRRILAYYIYRSVISIIVYLVPILVGVYVIDSFIQDLPRRRIYIVSWWWICWRTWN